ncbi:hypothetical protein [Mucisphaera calidilacus]|uniref:PEP-CTERM protein-sorting domain-containing protein n=1 Tax=Mucisphaera calidilacus TaxID=2527982 RepID=A0A518BVN3_9BACT|nr:hypothetical protein [Mucisphaera calidilacus]QDU71021.1 hypothetical protein Pan265_08660 [Mucisphaera calidilacus]
MQRLLFTAALALGLTATVSARTNLLVNPDFNDPEGFGTGWGAFGAADFNAFFGANGHASLYADRAENIGGVYQLGIEGAQGTSYTFDLLDVRIESNWDADLIVGLEYYQADDATKIGETLSIYTAEDFAQVDGNFLSMTGTAVPGTVYVRPIIQFNNVNGSYAGQSQANGFVFDTFLSETPNPGEDLLRNPGAGGPPLGHAWNSAGNIGFNEFFGEDNAHISLFADTGVNSGYVWQQKIDGEAGKEYRFTLEDVRIESSWDADLRFGLEFYGDDDANKLGEVIVPIDTSTTGDGLSFTMAATAVEGTAYVRPIVSFENVNFLYIEEPNANAFIFDTTLEEVLPDLLGDVNRDGVVDDLDIDLLYANLGSTDPLFDIGGNGGAADLSDVDALVEQVLGSLYGDSNLDQTVDLLDLSSLAASFDEAGGWANGDYNGDTIVNLLDLSILAMNFNQSSVPEPAAAALITLGWMIQRRRV